MHPRPSQDEPYCYTRVNGYHFSALFPFPRYANANIKGRKYNRHARFTPSDLDVWLFFPSFSMKWSRHAPKSFKLAIRGIKYYACMVGHGFRIFQPNGSYNLVKHLADPFLRVLRSWGVFNHRLIDVRFQEFHFFVSNRGSTFRNIVFKNICDAELIVFFLNVIIN